MLFPCFLLTSRMTFGPKLRLRRSPCPWQKESGSFGRRGVLSPNKNTGRCHGEKPGFYHGKWWFHGENPGFYHGKWWFHGENHGKTMGKSGDFMGKTMGKPWENLVISGGYSWMWMGFHGIISYDLPSGNLLHDYGTSPFFWWEKSPIFMAMFKFAFCMFTRPGNTLMDCDENYPWGSVGPPDIFVWP